MKLYHSVCGMSFLMKILFPLMRAVQEERKSVIVFVFQVANALPHHYTMHAEHGSSGRTTEQFS
jgi:hypothetical protein